MLDIVSWHGLAQQDHAHQVEFYSAQGYRLLSLSVYNTPQDPWYACVLIRRSVPVSEQNFWAMSEAQFKETLGRMSTQNMAPHIVSATGATDSAVFAASFILSAGIIPAPLTQHGLTGDQFKAANQQAVKSGLKLVWFDCYGTPADERYVGVWWPDPEMMAWSCDGIGETSAVTQQRFDGLTKTWARLCQCVATPGGKATSLYTDGSVGTSQAGFGLTSVEYAILYEQQIAQGLVPLRLCANGAGKAASFNVVFAQSEETVPRVFRSSGPITIPAIDTVIKAWLQAHNIRATALAIVDGARLVYAKGYTWAEPGYPDVQPTTLFRQASCSKVFTAYALYCLLQERISKMPAGATFAVLMSQITLQSILELKQPDGKPPKDPKFSKITLLDLMTSTSGLNQHLLWRSAEAAAAAQEPLPATRTQLASYAAAQTFTATPGDSKNVVYGNFDYFLLGEVVRSMSGAPSFEAALAALILAPLQMTRVRGSRSLIEDQRPGEAIYQLTQPDNEGLPELAARGSLRTPARPLVAGQYGGTDMEMIGACGGLSVAVTDMARLIASLSLRTGNPVLNAATIEQWLTNAAIATRTLSGPAAHGYHGWDWVRAAKSDAHVFSGGKGGSLPGTGTQVFFTTGGLSYIMMAVDQSRLGVKYSWARPLMDAAQAQNWGEIDLFPQFGMASFAVQESRAGVTVAPDLDELIRNGPSGHMTFPPEP